MRISDWSSDVCSSDLQPQCAVGDLLRCAQPAHRYILGEEILDVRDAHRVDRGRVDRAGADAIHANAALGIGQPGDARSEEHTSELQSLMRISYAVFCLKKKIHAKVTLSHKSLTSHHSQDPTRTRQSRVYKTFFHFHS